MLNTVVISTFETPTVFKSRKNQGKKSGLGVLRPTNDFFSQMKPTLAHVESKSITPLFLGIF